MIYLTVKQSLCAALAFAAGLLLLGAAVLVILGVGGL